MSYSLRSAKNTTGIIEPSVSSTEKKTSQTSFNETIKSNISTSTQHNKVDSTTYDETSKKKDQCDTATLTPIKFINAATMVSSTNTNSNAIPEISDEELLQMALAFEKEQQQ